MATSSCTISECIQLKSMLKLLKQYEQINHNDCKDQEKLIAICTEYKSLLEDRIHIITQHNDVEKMYDLTMTLIDGTKCDVTNCEISMRHNGNKDKDESFKDIDADFILYRDILDSIHCYLFHLWDYGFRTPRSDAINETNQCKLDRIDNNDKYNINSNEFTESDVTFMDVFIEHLIDNKMTYIIKELVEEQYDSDSMEMDVAINSDEKSCNIATFATKQQDFDLITEYIRHHQVMKFSFSIGYTFYYWNYYIDKVNEHEQHLTNLKNHLGYKPHQLYIKKKYKSLKEEILNNKIFALKQHQFVMSLQKCTKYMNTATVKKMKSVKFAERRLHYNIGSNKPISKEHVLSVILRCDWTQLCTQFTATFRKAKSYEPLLSIKKRNREYAIWSRLIREIVEYYGRRGKGDEDEESNTMINMVKGPFYCGMSFKMVIPEFNIRICGPTSTSKQKAVAERFAGQTGILLKLNNTGHWNADNLRIFGCSWISNYSGEDEYLFAGGQYQIRIQSIKDMKSKQNYQIFCNALFYFDCLIKGTGMDEDDMNLHKIDYEILNNLILHKVGINGFKNKYEKYVNDLFEAMVNHHTQIVINLYQLNEHLKLIKDLIIYSKNNTKSEAKINLLKDEIIKLFPNINEIVIYSTKHDGLEEYEFVLNELFVSMNRNLDSNIKGLRIMIKATRWDDDEPSWLYDAVKDEANLDDDQSCILSLIQTKDHEGLTEDCVIIQY